MDVFIILLSWVGQIMVFVLDDNLKEAISIGYALQVLRVFRIVKVFTFAKDFSTSFLKILFEVFSTLLLIIIILLIYSIIGIDFFCYLKPTNHINQFKVNFRSIGRTFVTLTRIITFEEWHNIFADCLRQIQPNFVCHEIKNYSDYVKYG